MHLQLHHWEISAVALAGTSWVCGSPAPSCLAAVTRRHSAWADLRRLPLHSPGGRMVSTWGPGVDAVRLVGSEGFCSAARRGCDPCSSTSLEPGTTTRAVGQAACCGILVGFMLGR